MKNSAIKKIRFEEKYVEIFFEGSTKYDLSAKSGDFINLLEEKGLYDYVINKGIRGIVITHVGDEILDLSYPE